MGISRKSPVLAAFVSALLFVPGLSLAGKTNDLESLKTKYEAARREIRAAALKREENVLQHYGVALDDLMGGLKQEGDLNAYLVVEDERKRFTAEGTVPTSAVPALAGTIEVYRNELRSAEGERERQNAILLKKYEAALGDLIKQLMRAGKIDEAKAVKEEQDKVGFELAASDADASMTASGRNADSSPMVQEETWISADATYTVSSIYHAGTFTATPFASLLTGQGASHGPFAFHTAEGDGDPHIVIDLGTLKTVTKVCIWNRSNAPERAKSLALWVSSSPSFDRKPVWKADKVQDDWTVSLQRPTKVRYIKLGLLDGGILHLKLVKVFGMESPSTAATTSKKLIPKEATAFRGHHYLYVTAKLGWHDAKKTCEELGGHLVTIASVAENEFVSDLVDNALVWLGFTDEAQPNTWVWVTGEPASYTSWSANEPNHDGTQRNYALYRNHNSSDWYNWSDDCELGYVCEWDR